MDDNANNILYLRPETLRRLIDQQRVGVWDRNGPVTLTFRPDDPRYAGRPVGIADDVTPHAVHRRTEQVFEWVEKV